MLWWMLIKPSNHGGLSRDRVFWHTSAGASSLTQEIVDGHNYTLDLVYHMAIFLNLLFYTPLKRKTKSKYLIYYMPLKRKQTSRFTHFQKNIFFIILHTPAIRILRVCINDIRRGKQYNLDSIKSFYFHNECIH